MTPEQQIQQIFTRSGEDYSPEMLELARRALLALRQPIDIATVAQRLTADTAHLND